jgi:hypothetical protein
MRTPSFILLILFALSVFQAHALDPVVTVRFSNPVYTCSTQTYKLDVEFQCNTANKQLFGMNVRFYYAYNILQFQSFGDFVTGYSQVVTPAVTVMSPSSGMTMFGFTGAAVYVNGAIQKTGSSSLILSTTGWTKIFSVTFHVVDPNVININSFCPVAIWDLKENPADGGIGPGIIITVVNGSGSSPATENCVQFNWQYDGVPGYPYGNPVPTNCISTQSSYAPSNHLPVIGFDTPGTINVPVTVTNFNSITALSLIFEYDPAVMTYSSCTPNSIFTTETGLLNVSDSVCTNGKHKIKMYFQGSSITLANNTHLVDLNFNYISGTTDLAWKTGSSYCYYKGIGNVTKCDQPYSNFYLNGSVNSMLAPIIRIDSGSAVTGDYITFSVRVRDYDNILSGMLTLNYNPEVLVYQDVIPNNAIASSFIAQALTPGTLEMTWDNSDTSLTDESILMYLTFQYVGEYTDLIWSDEDETACQYINSILLQPLTDDPDEYYYLNGSVTNSTIVWTGQNSGDWNSAANWSRTTAPNQLMNVIIDPSTNPLNWPTFNGNFTLGENCKNLTLNGNAIFTINGDLMINPGHKLDLGSSGTLQVNGNWTNSGIFEPGTGTVEFTGTNDAIIAEGDPPGNFVANYALTTFSAEMIPITGGNSGPTGDNAHSDVNIGFNFGYLGTNYSQVRINTNGWISLNSTGTDAVSDDNTILFRNVTPTTVLAPWWDDLNADASTTVSYLTEGSAPSRIFTAEWKNILAYYSGVTTRLSFQVKLYETSNIIEFRYGHMTVGTHDDDEGASIGIKDATGGIGNFKEATQNSSEIILSSLKSDSDWPTVNYRFSPPEENDMELFYKIIVTKSTGTLQIQRDVKVTGLD